jgi:nucleoside 2-deoxyribosyltransferase
MYNVYLCGSIANAHINRMTTDLLTAAGYEVFDPCSIVPHNAEKMDFPEAVYSQCKSAIERCDILFVFLDSFGKDSAWEVGFARGLGKYIIGVAAGTSLFLEDWMVKHALDQILVLENSWLASTINSEEWNTVRAFCEVVDLSSIPTFLAHAIAIKRQLPSATTSSARR